MFVKLLIALSAFAFLAKAKECKPGRNCDLKCCTTSEGDVECRARCLGLSCELDAHCDGDCCVNSTCTSCLVKRLFTKDSSALRSTIEPATTKSQEAADFAVEVKPTNECSRLNNRCASKCCIDGQCVDRSRCVPKAAPRRGGGKVRRGGGGGGGSSGDSDWPAWAWGIVAGGAFLFGILVCLLKYFCYKG